MGADEAGWGPSLGFGDANAAPAPTHRFRRGSLTGTPQPSSSWGDCDGQTAGAADLRSARLKERLRQAFLKASMAELATSKMEADTVMTS
jgi:hypothetical protein